MNAHIISVGTELLMGEILNTNTKYIAEELNIIGIGVYRQSVVGDNLSRIVTELTRAFEEADIVITTGGLGPTKDDLTKEAAAAFLKREMILDEATLDGLVKFFSKRGIAVNEGNKKQAYFPVGSVIIKNNNGTAPGCLIEFDLKTLIILPGPPREVIPMMEEYVLPYLEKRSDKMFATKVVNIAGIGEGNMEEMILDLVENQSNPTIAPYAKEKGLTLRVTASAPSKEEAEILIEPVLEQIKERLGENIVAIGDTDLESVVSKMLIDKKLSISVAESCTAGLLAGRLVNYPGISAVFNQGYITYSDEAKIRMLGVRKETLEEYGAVSEQTAAEMARGAAQGSGSDIAVSITGIAGPDGGSIEKPVGLVYIGLFIKGETKVKKLDLWGSRQNIRNRSVGEALDFLRRELMKY